MDSYLMSFRLDNFVLCACYVDFCFFKQNTAYEMRISDWSSDVCSSDLRPAATGDREAHRRRLRLHRHGPLRAARLPDLTRRASAKAPSFRAGYWPDRKSVV